MGNGRGCYERADQTLLGYYVKFHEESEKDPSLEDEARECFHKAGKRRTEETKLWQWFPMSPEGVQPR
jgi:arginyl-tRNA synthetase